MTNVLDFCPPGLNRRVQSIPHRVTQASDAMTPRPVTRPAFGCGDPVVSLPLAMPGTIEDMSYMGRWIYAVRLADGALGVHTEGEMAYDGGPDAA